MRDILIMLGLGILGYVLVWKLWPATKLKGQSLGRRAPETDPPQSQVNLWHQVLGVHPGASVAEITKAYRTQVSQYHPDKVAHMGSEIRRVAEEKTKQLNAAYDEGVVLRSVGM